MKDQNLNKNPQSTILNSMSLNFGSPSHPTSSTGTLHPPKSPQQTQDPPTTLDIQSQYYRAIAKHLGLHQAPRLSIYLGCGADLLGVLSLTQSRDIIGIERQDISPKILALWISLGPSAIHRDRMSQGGYLWKTCWQSRIASGYWRTAFMQEFGIERCIAAELGLVQAKNATANNPSNGPHLAFEYDGFLAPGEGKAQAPVSLQYISNLYSFLHSPQQFQGPCVFIIKSCDGLTKPDSFPFQKILKKLPSHSYLFIGEPCVKSERVNLVMLQIKRELETLACKEIAIPDEIQRIGLDHYAQNLAFQKYGWEMRVFQKGE
jgi:hypothetical protein